MGPGNASETPTLNTTNSPNTATSRTLPRVIDEDIYLRNETWKSEMAETGGYFIYIYIFELDVDVA